MIYNIFDQAPEDKLFPVCRELNVGVIARVPLDEGSLGGKMTRETKFPPHDWRARYFGPENLPETIDRVDELKKIVPPGMALPDMALRFILSNPTVSTTIVGMRKPEHVRQNIALSDAGPLDAALLKKLKATAGTASGNPGPTKMTNDRIQHPPKEWLTTPKLQHAVIPNRPSLAAVAGGSLEGSAVDVTACAIRYGAPLNNGNAHPLWHNRKGSFGSKNEAQPLLAVENQ